MDNSAWARSAFKNPWYSIYEPKWPMNPPSSGCRAWVIIKLCSHSMSISAAALSKNYQHFRHYCMTDVKRILEEVQAFLCRLFWLTSPLSRPLAWTGCTSVPATARTDFERGKEGVVSRWRGGGGLSQIRRPQKSVGIVPYIHFTVWEHLCTVPVFVSLLTYKFYGVKRVNVYCS
jgi:hypothetical protein